MVCGGRARGAARPAHVDLHVEGHHLPPGTAAIQIVSFRSKPLRAFGLDGVSLRKVRDDHELIRNGGDFRTNELKSGSNRRAKSSEGLSVFLQGHRVFGF